MNTQHICSLERPGLIRAQINVAQAPPHASHSHGQADGKAGQDESEGEHDWSVLPTFVDDEHDDGSASDDDESWLADETHAARGDDSSACARHRSALLPGGRGVGGGADHLRREVSPGKGCQNAIRNTRRQLFRPFVNRFIGDADCLCGCGDGSAEQFDGSGFVHAALNHSSASKATMVLGCPVTCQTMVEFNERLAAAIAHAKTSMPALAAHLHVTPQALRKYKKGTSNLMAADNLARTARFCGVSIYWLATGEGAMLDDDAESARTRHITIRDATRFLARCLSEKTPTAKKWAASLLSDLALNPDAVEDIADHLEGLINSAAARAVQPMSAGSASWRPENRDSEAHQVEVEPNLEHREDEPATAPRLSSRKAGPK